MLVWVASLQLSTGPPSTYPTIRHFLTPTDHHDHHDRHKPHQLHHLHHQYRHQAGCAVILIVAGFDFTITSIFFVITATRMLRGCWEGCYGVLKWPTKEVFGAPPARASPYSLPLYPSFLQHHRSVCICFCISFFACPPFSLYPADYTFWICIFVIFEASCLPDNTPTPRTGPWRWSKNKGAEFSLLAVGSAHWAGFSSFTEC